MRRRNAIESSPAEACGAAAAPVYAASLVSPEPPRRQRSVRRMSPRAAAMQRVSSVSLFGRATAAAYAALSRRAG